MLQASTINYWLNLAGKMPFMHTAPTLLSHLQSHHLAYITDTDLFSLQHNARINVVRLN